MRSALGASASGLDSAPRCTSRSMMKRRSPRSSQPAEALVQRHRAARGVSACNVRSGETARLRRGERHVGAQVAREARVAHARVGSNEFRTNRKKVRMRTSKPFHATLPWLDDAEMSRLRAWAWQDSAASSLAREDDVAIWRATEERARTREAFLRSVRSTLKRLASASRAPQRLRHVTAERSVASPRRRR